MSEKKVSAHVIISGKVQGVWFRAETQKAAQQIGGVRGWVRNKKDKTVEAVFEGDENRVVSMLEWCKKGSPLSKVEKTEVTWQEYSGTFGDFQIRY
ncbi:MAG: acylphosphatase [Desulfococcaceae bacterium]|nr:acylphosphatase [Desulfococcaceae bacterium]